MLSYCTFWAAIFAKIGARKTFGQFDVFSTKLVVGFIS